MKAKQKSAKSYEKRIAAMIEAAYIVLDFARLEMSMAGLSKEQYESLQQLIDESFVEFISADLIK